MNKLLWPHLEECSRQSNEQSANDRGSISQAQSDAIEGHVLNILQPSGEDSILDVGCGTGLITLQIAKLAGKVAAVDVVPGQCERTRLRCSTMNNVEVILADAAQLPFPAARFNKVLFYDANIYFSRSELWTILREFHRVLSPGGVVLVGDLCHPWCRYRQLRFYNQAGFGRAVYGAFAKFLKMILRGGEKGWYWPTDFKAMCRSAGFQMKLVPQTEELPFHLWRYDVLLTKMP